MLGILLTFFQSCENSKTEPLDTYAYYPLEIGRYQIYEVQETVYSSGQKDPVVTTWQEKDEVDRIASSGDNVTTYVVTRYKRNSADSYWLKFKEYTVTKSPDKILTSIDNQTVFSLAFPADSKVKWNGNLYNDGDARNYTYQNIGKPLQLGDLRYNHTLTVLERKDTSIIDRYVGIKTYALATGLILDEQTAFQYCQDDDCIGMDIIESGTYRVKKILETGIAE
ncbi:hypothetical protein DYBT9275_03958 [Dyadobacter sp. CECT 9275]|uniref:Uncharacterized protein n=2 Tax=Dyadobacter helix TaxID=2822344 RepID=A0A916N757_9BACT|nr:hypothetical protein DYBT9275_03958 [Dyadobacter sp. CECT 9275]